jgi:hypothetical protein
VVGIEKAWRDQLESVVADPGTCLNCLVTKTRRLVDRQAKRLAAFLRCEMSPIASEPLLMSGTIQQTEKLKIEKYITPNTPGTLDFSMQIQ